MPVIRNGGSAHVEYKIPEGIKEKIPEHFYYALGGELFSIFGPSLFEETDGYYDLASSTGGWEEAFKETCRKLGMEWLSSYWEALPWHDSDILDGIIENEVIKRFCGADMPHANPYYAYLCDKSRKRKEGGT